MSKALVVFFLLWACASAFSPLTWSQSKGRVRNGLLKESTERKEAPLFAVPANAEDDAGFDRRQLLRSLVGFSFLPVASTLLAPSVVDAASSTTATAEVTDKIFLEVKSPTAPAPQRIVIGLFGKDAPRCTDQLKKLVTKSVGLAAPCKPRETRTLQKEQLEANKVYNSCMENQDTGVNYEYATVWRIIKNERIDVGSVSGKFISRQFPVWDEKSDNGLRHDAFGTVSVQRGNDSGFGFTIHPSSSSSSTLDETHIVIGRVVEGLDVIDQWNQTPVITSAKGINYMGLTGGPATKSAPSRSCYYGGPMYCNENKPLQKLSIVNTGVL